MVTQNVINLFYRQCAIHSLDVLELVGDEIVFGHDFLDEVVGGDVFAVDDHVVDEVELEKGDQFAVQGVQGFSVFLLDVLCFEFCVDG